MVQLPGFEPGSRTWQLRILTKLYYNCNKPRGLNLDIKLFLTILMKKKLMDKIIQEKIEQKIRKLF